MEIGEFEKLAVSGVLPLEINPRTGGSGADEGEPVLMVTSALWGLLERFLRGLIRRQ